MGVSYLLDTHAVIWLVGRARPVRSELREALEGAETRVMVSAVSAFEVTTKVRLGKLETGRALAERWEKSVSEMGGEPLALSHSHAVLAGSLDWEHRDPFDRLLAAQAIAERLTLVTADRAIAAAPGLLVQPW